MFGRPINYGKPVAEHPLNLGLSAWWMGLPQWSGGMRLFDLLGRYPGTLTSGPTWTAGPPSALFPAIRYDGSDDVVTATQPTTSGATALSVEVVMAGDNAGSSAGLWCGGNTAFNGSFFVGRDNSDAQFWAGAQKYGTTATGAPSTVDGVWRIWHMTFEASTRVRMIANGTTWTNSTTSVPASIPSHSGVEIGKNLTGNFAYAGRLASVAIWPSRVLSDSDVKARYDQWMRGFPDVINYVSGRVYSFGTSVAGGGGGGGGTGGNLLLLGVG